MYSVVSYMHVDFFHDRITCMHGLVVGLTVRGSFACAPRLEIALIGFISTGR